LSNCGKPIRFICITTEGCDKTFGVTCNGTGEPCDGTISRCSDVCSFNCVNKKEYFKDCEGTEGVKYPVNAVPSIQDIKTTAPRFNFENGIFTGGKLTVTFMDHAHSGIGFDPYYNHPDRTGGGPQGYDCTDPSNSFWRRWKVANCFVKGRTVELFRGFEGDDIEDMSVTSWSISGTPSGPSTRCTVTLSAIDKISQLDFDKKYPEDTTATHLLFQEILGPDQVIGVDPFLYVDGGKLPNYQSLTPIDGTSENVFVKINDEILKLRYRYEVIDENAKFGVRALYDLEERAVCGTKIPDQEHQVGDPIQVIVNFSCSDAGMAMLGMIRSITGYQAKLDCQCGPGADNSTCIDNESFAMNGSQDGCKKKLVLGDKALITKPTSIKNLLKKFFNEYFIFPYCSRIDGCIRLCCFAPDCDPESISGSCFKSMDTEKKEIEKSLYTGVVIFADAIDNCDNVSKKNFKVAKIYGAESLAQDQCSQYYLPDSIKEIMSDWSNGKSLHLADSTGSRWLYISRKERNRAVFEINNCQYRDILEDLDFGQQYFITDDNNIDPNDMYFISSIDESGSEYTKITVESTGLKTDTRWLHCEVRQLEPGECVEGGPQSECNPQEKCLEIW